MDIERRLTEKRYEKESKKKKEREKDSKYAPKTVIVVISFNKPIFILL